MTVYDEKMIPSPDPAISAVRRINKATVDNDPKFIDQVVDFYIRDEMCNRYMDINSNAKLNVDYDLDSLDMADMMMYLKDAIELRYSSVVSKYLSESLEDSISGDITVGDLKDSILNSLNDYQTYCDSRAQEIVESVLKGMEEEGLVTYSSEKNSHPNYQELKRDLGMDSQNLRFFFDRLKQEANKLGYESPFNLGDSVNLLFDDTKSQPFIGLMHHNDLSVNHIINAFSNYLQKKSSK